MQHGGYNNFDLEVGDGGLALVEADARLGALPYCGIPPLGWFGLMVGV